MGETNSFELGTNDSNSKLTDGNLRKKISSYGQGLAAEIHQMIRQLRNSESSLLEAAQRDFDAEQSVWRSQEEHYLRTIECLEKRVQEKSDSGNSNSAEEDELEPLPNDDQERAKSARSESEVDGECKLSDAGQEDMNVSEPRDEDEKTDCENSRVKKDDNTSDINKVCILESSLSCFINEDRNPVDKACAENGSDFELTMRVNDIVEQKHPIGRCEFSERYDRCEANGPPDGDESSEFLRRIEDLSERLRVEADRRAELEREVESMGERLQNSESNRDFYKHKLEEVQRVLSSKMVNHETEVQKYLQQNNTLLKMLRETEKRRSDAEMKNAEAEREWKLFESDATRTRRQLETRLEKRTEKLKMSVLETELANAETRKLRRQLGDARKEMKKVKNKASDCEKKYCELVENLKSKNSEVSELEDSSFIMYYLDID